MIRAPSPDPMGGSSCRDSGGQAIVNEDGGTAAEVRPQAIASIQAQLSLDLTTLRYRKSGNVNVGISQAQRFHEPLVQESAHRPADRSDPELFKTWRAKLADDDDVERRVQRDRDLIPNHDATPWQAKDVRLRVLAGADALGEYAAGLGPVGEAQRFVERS